MWHASAGGGYHVPPQAKGAGRGHGRIEGFRVAGKTFRCRLITPEAQILDSEAVYASIPAWDGLFGVQPGRSALVAKLGMGELRLDFPDSAQGRGGSRFFFIEDGFVQMVHDRLTILARQAQPMEQLVESDAEAELAEAMSRTVPSDHPQSAKEVDAVNHARRRAEVKLRLAKKAKSLGI